MKQITVLGSTGSIGTSVLELVRGAGGRFSLSCLTANRQIDKLAEQAREFRPQQVVIAEPSLYQPLKELLADTDIEVAAGPQALCDAAAAEADLVIAGIVGFAGLAPLMAAVGAGRKIALANKEALVVAGHIIMPALARTGAEILPVDSEHNAIFQCLEGNNSLDIEEIILTASGGPFRDLSADQLAGVTISQALAHPNWEMGRKITIDSATLMNKGLELIEAAWLFDQPRERLSAIIHPQSVVHGLVRFCDGSLLAQLGPADMKVPLSHALGWPERHSWPAERLDLAALGQLDFRPIDRQAFPCFDLACQVIGMPPAHAVMLNAANEEAVAAFLDGRLAFIDIAAVISAVMDQAEPQDCAELAAIREMDSQSRRLAANIIEKGKLTGAGS